MSPPGDGISLSLSLGKHLPPDDPNFKKHAEEAMNGSIAFANQAKDIVAAYFNRQGDRHPAHAVT